MLTDYCPRPGGRDIFRDIKEFESVKRNVDSEMFTSKKRLFRNKCGFFGRRIISSNSA